MTFQHRKIPYRTHHIQNSTERQTRLPPGRYAGRVLDIEKTEQTFLVRVLLEENYYQFPTDGKQPFCVGELLVFEVDHQGRLNPIESLFSPSSSLDPKGDIFRWRALGEPVPRMRRLKLRHRLLRQIRAYFDQEGFLEVDTPLLVKAPSPESQFTLLATEEDFLITSPEFQMKRMLVGGFEKIYQITSCFRGKEVGRFHNPEFTMLEWYRAYDCLGTLVDDLEGIIGLLAEISPHVHKHYLQTRSFRILLKPPWEHCSVAELFDHHLGLDIQEAQSAQQLREIAIAGGYASLVDEIPDHYEQIFFCLWDRFESQLGVNVPLLVYDWPMPLASLAQSRVEKPGVAERMELYIAGVELANGFGELTDPQEQRRRFEQNLLDRQSNELPSVPIDEVFLESLTQGMPPSAGMALGIDRLIMLFTGASQIQEVMCFGYDER